MKVMEIQAYVVYQPHSEKGRPMSIGGHIYSVRGPWRLTLRADLVKSFAGMPNGCHDNATYLILDGEGPDYLLVEHIDHFTWRLRFVLDNDQMMRHDFLFEENTNRPDALPCLICYRTNSNDLIHGDQKGRVFQ